MGTVNRSGCRHYVGKVEVSRELLDRLERDVCNRLDAAMTAAGADGATRLLPGHLERVENE